MKLILQKILSGFLSGLLISMGGIIFLLCENNVVGATLFSVGLMMIVTRGYLLYTGIIGEVPNNFKWSFAWLIFLCLIGNLLGTSFAGLFIPDGHSLILRAETVTEAKVAKSALRILFDSIGCGVLMYLAVNSYKQFNKNYLLLIFPVIVFILAGFEHSIADMFYFAASGYLFSVDGILLTLLIILGNAIGAIAFSLIHKFVKLELGK